MDGMGMLVYFDFGNVLNVRNLSRFLRGFSWTWVHEPTRIWKTRDSKYSKNIDRLVVSTHVKIWVKL